jgi:hypothetical protein
MFVSIKAGSYPNFKRALATNDLLLIRAAAAELPKVDLRDALEFLPVIATAEPMTYDRAACRRLARLALETSVGLEQLGVALGALDRLPEDSARSVEVLARFAR